MSEQTIECFQDEMQCVFDTDGHSVLDSEDNETGSGVDFENAMAIAKEADGRIAELEAKLAARGDSLPVITNEVLGDYTSEAFIEFDESGRPQWTQSAVDFACLCSSPKWISVEDRLPITEKDMGNKKYNNVMVIIRTDDTVCIDYFEAGNTMEFWCKFHEYGDEVIEWQPLPEPPSEG